MDTSAKRVVIKVNYGDDLRRFTFNSEKSSFAALHDTVLGLYRGIDKDVRASLVLKYVDDEGDLITMSSDVEFEEALMQLDGNRKILRLSLVPGNEPSQVACCAGDDRPSHCVPTAARRLIMPPLVPTLGENFRRWRNRRANYHMLQAEALQLMESGDRTDVEKARGLFERQAETCPRRRCVPLYNIACCDALLGNLESAMTNLKLSIEGGYRNGRHMASDPDLNALHPLKEFRDLVATMGGTVPVQEPAAEAAKEEVKTEVAAEVEESSVDVAVAVNVQPEPAAPVVEEPAAPEHSFVVIPHRFEDHLKVLADMGFDKRDKNIAVLDQTDGSLTDAVQLLLQMDY